MRLTLTIVGIFIALSSSAQGLSYAMAREEMLSNNLEIQAAHDAIEIAQLELRAARGLRLPAIDFLASYTLMQRDIEIDLGSSKGTLSNTAQHIIDKGISDGIITPGIANLITEGLSHILAADWSLALQKRSTFIGAATIAQPIYMGGRINAAVTAAEIKANQAEYQLQALTNNLTTQLIELYYGIVLAERNIEVRNNVVKGIEQHLNDAIELEKEGLIPHSDVLYVQYKLSEAERELSTASSKLVVVRKALSKILNRECSENLTDRIFIVDSIYNIDYYIQMATDINPIIQHTRGDIALSEQGIKVARAALLPEISALGGAIIASHNLTSMLPRWSAGIGLRLNIFNGLVNKRNLQAANKTQETVFTISEITTDNITLLVENEYYNTINSLKYIDMTQTSIEFARAYLRTKHEGFIEGVTTSKELIDAELELQAAELEQMEAGYNFCKFLARLLEASGASDTFENYHIKAIFL